MVPIMMALAGASVVIISSHVLPGEKKIFAQAIAFTAALSGSAIYIVAQQESDMVKFWATFTSLDEKTQFCISVIAITVTYFGAAMYVAPYEGPEGNSSASLDLSTPASCDMNVGFSVPADLPEDDKIMFEKFLDRYCCNDNYNIFSL